MTAPVPPEIATRAARRTRLFMITLAAAALVMMLPLPWRLSGLGFGALALVTGVRIMLDLVAVRRAGGHIRGWPGVALGLALATFLVLLFAGQAAFYPLFAEQQRCTAGAVTHLDAEQCRAEFQRRQEEIIRRLQPR